MAAATPKQQDVSYRGYEHSDYEGVLALLRKVFPETTSEAAFRWRFETHPRGPSLRVVALADGKVVGFNSWMPWPIEFQGRPLKVWQSGESAVDSSMRGKGVFGGLIRHGAELATAEDGDLFIGFPNDASLRAFQKAGWKLVSTLGWWVAPTPLSWVGLQWASHAKPRGLPSPDRVEPFAFLHEPDFFQWRFVENPYHTYRIDELPDGCKIVSRLRRRWPLRERFVLIGIDQNGSLLDPGTMMRSVARRARGSAFIATAVTDEVAARSELAQQGFRRLQGKGIYFIVLRLNTSLPEETVYDPVRWMPTPGDVDIT